jgi:ubiquitin carboxyl-terminal hydrolase 8
MIQIQRSPDYHNMMASKVGQNYHNARNLGNNLFAKKDQFKNIRSIIENENKRTSLAPSSSHPQYHAIEPETTRPSSQGSAVPSILQPGNTMSTSSNGPISPSVPSSLQPASPKSRPIVKPKPDNLHGKSLSERFAALRMNGASPHPGESGELADPNELLRMPSPSSFQPVKSTNGVYNDTNALSKPAGPRPMPTSSNLLSNGPSLPPKLPIDTNIANSFPRAPSPAYSPARNMQTPSSINPPRTSARSMVGTGGRAASVASARPPNGDYDSTSYFPRNGNQASLDGSRRKGVVGLSLERTVTADKLFDFLKMYDILLIDVRSRPEFDGGHIDSSSVICVEPLQLRPGISAMDIESSLSISPDAEETMFSSRSKYDFVVFYDQSTSNPSYMHAPRTEHEESLRVLHDALVEYNIEAPLKNPPMLLDGGIDAWVDLLGQASLQTSHTHVGRPTRRSISHTPSMANSLLVGRRRHREWNPLNAEEERQWLERARTESVSMPPIPDLSGRISVDDIPEESPQDDAAFYRSRDDFLRRYPSVSLEQESMVVPQRYDSQMISPPPSRPVSQQMYVSAPNAPFNPEMPIRPAPAAPRVSYSGAHDRNAHQPFNNVRNKNLAPYISPQEMPSNVRIPRTGLVNFGSTCYMNSVIQCLSATVPLTMRFQDGSYKKWLQRDNWKGSRGLLPEHYANLVSNLWLNDVAACRPMTFRKFCARLNADWGTDRHQDANDFYIFIMEYLHEDLNVFWRNPPPHVLSKQEEESREKLPMFLAASIEWDRWSKRERSLISDLFAGQHASQLRCLTCKNTSTTYEPWYNLSIELPSRGNVRLEECLASYCREERLGRGHEWQCPHCQKTREATKRITLTKAPPYLVVHFKRFHADSSGNAHKVSTVVDFPLQGLDLAPYMLTPPTPNEVTASSRRSFDQSMLGPFKYNAYAIVEHFGKGLSSGHYISWIHDRPRNVWRKFDDSSVSDMPAIKPAGAYLVFYERVNWVK